MLKNALALTLAAAMTLPVATLDGIGEGRGGYWEDRGYQWYAGV